MFLTSVPPTPVGFDEFIHDAKKMRLTVSCELSMVEKGYKEHGTITKDELALIQDVLSDAIIHRANDLIMNSMEIKLLEKIQSYMIEGLYLSALGDILTLINMKKAKIN